MGHASNNPANNARSNPHNSETGKRPDERDNLDSRKNEEQDSKGDDLTSNKKETKKDKLKKDHHN